MTAGLLELELVACPICNGHGQVAAGVQCACCHGSGVTSEQQARTYAAALEAAYVDGARARAKQLGAAGADMLVRQAAQHRAEAAAYYQATATAAKQAETHVYQAQLVHAQTALLIDQARADFERILAAAPVLPPLPPGATPQVPGAGVKDPLLVIDSIQVRELDVWGPLNAPFINSAGVLVQPSGDVTGTKDTATVQPLLTAGLAVTLNTAAGPFYFGAAGSGANGLTVTSPGGYLAGNGGGSMTSANPIYYLGTGIGIYMHGGAIPYPQNVLGGQLRNFVVDMSLAGAGACGIDWGDGDCLVLDNVRVANNAFGPGIREINRFGYTEKSWVRVQIFNCAIAYQFQDVGTGVTHSHWYSWHDIHVNLYNSQAGVQFLPSFTGGGSSGIHNAQRFAIRGNLNTTTITGGTGATGTGVLLDFSTASGHVDSSSVHITCEVDGAGNWTWQSIKFGASGAMLNDSGHIIFSDGPTNWVNSDLSAVGTFSFGGYLSSGHGTTALLAFNSAPSGWAQAAAPLQFAPGPPTGTNSTSPVMMGIGTTAGRSYTPQSNGNTLVVITGAGSNNTAADGFSVSGRFGVGGTGSAPANGVAATGTRINANGEKTLTNPTANDNLDFCIVGILPLTAGTAYWFDVALAAVTGGTASVTNLQFAFFELN